MGFGNHIVNVVLILVLVEDGLGETTGEVFNSIGFRVLILVLVEDGLGDVLDLHTMKKLTLS